jgi:hypothetical protein
MTQLQTLSLHFLALPARRNYLSLPPSTGDRMTLPALIHFKYQGTSKYLDTLVARLDAPRLEDIYIRFFSQPTLDASQLGLFIEDMGIRRSPLRADIISSSDTISIAITQSRVITWLRLQISCKQLDWQLSSMSQICDHFSSFLFRVEDLRIKTTGLSSVLDSMVDEQWLRLFRTFDGAKDFHVASELATDILHVLHLADEGHKIMLPALRNLHVKKPMPMRAPLRDSLDSFASQRQFSGHPVRIYISGTEYVTAPAFSSILSQSAGAVPIRRPTQEEITSAKRWVEEQKRIAFNRSSYNHQSNFLF